MGKTKNNYAFINKSMRTHVEILKQQARAIAKANKIMTDSKEALKRNVVADALGTNADLPLLPTSLESK